jgi:hypothetical protein
MQSRWQVPEWWRRGLHLEIAALLYGLVLGTGFATAIVLSAFWVFVALSTIAQTPLVLLAWAIYGGARAVGFEAASKGHLRFNSPAALTTLRIVSAILASSAVSSAWMIA